MSDMSDDSKRHVCQQSLAGILVSNLLLCMTSRTSMSFARRERSRAQVLHIGRLAPHCRHAVGRVHKQNHERGNTPVYDFMSCEVVRVTLE
jgi:hypothetical protein